MKTKTTAAVIALMLAPSVLWAACTNDDHASSCKEGFVWDSSKATCVAKPTT